MGDINYTDVLTILGGIFAIATAVEGILSALAKITGSKREAKWAADLESVLEKAAAIAGRFGLDFTKRK